MNWESKCFTSDICIISLNKAKWAGFKKLPFYTPWWHNWNRLHLREATVYNWHQKCSRPWAPRQFPESLTLPSSLVSITQIRKMMSWSAKIFFHEKGITFSTLQATKTIIISENIKKILFLSCCYHYTVSCSNRCKIIFWAYRTCRESCSCLLSCR